MTETIRSCWEQLSHQKLTTRDSLTRNLSLADYVAVGARSMFVPVGATRWLTDAVADISYGVAGLVGDRDGLAGVRSR